MARNLDDGIASDTEHPLSPTSPRADYGLNEDDGFDPARYDFYNQVQTKPRRNKYIHSRPQHFTNADDRSSSRQIADDRAEGTPSSPNSTTDKVPSSLHLPPIEEQEDDPQLASETTGDEERASILATEGASKKPPLHEAGMGPEDDERSTSLHKLSNFLFSTQHLRLVLEDHDLFRAFESFLSLKRPESAPLLSSYVTLRKALRSVEYADAVMAGVQTVSDNGSIPKDDCVAMPWVIQDRMDRILNALNPGDFRAFIADVYAKMVSAALADRVTGKENSTKSDIADGLAEVFALSDPARPDNPVVFTSDDFQQMTGYSRKDVLGQNCRMLQGTKSPATETRGFRDSLEKQKEHCEVLLNYRKDGSAFFNLVMCVPLRDQSKRLRYYLGAQLDITSLLFRCRGLPTLRSFLYPALSAPPSNGFESIAKAQGYRKDAFEKLGEAFDLQELQWLALLHQRRAGVLDSSTTRKSMKGNRGPSLTGGRSGQASFDAESSTIPAYLGFYRNYLLVRPYPSLRVLFASSELEAVGVTQKPLTSLIGGSARVRQHLANALEIGRKVTAKVVWKCGDGEEDRLCWIHCTPLLGSNNVIGVWMVILVDTDESMDNEEMTKPPTLVQDSDSFAAFTYSAAITPWDQRIPTQSIGGLFSTGRTRVRSQSSGQTSLSSSRDIEYRNGSRRDLGDVASAHHFQDTKASSGGGPIPLYQSKGDMPTSPLRDELQPKTRKPGQNPQLTAGTKLPINLPGVERNQDMKLDNPVGRRTYKSLSPYGVLFQN